MRCLRRPTYWIAMSIYALILAILADKLSFWQFVFVGGMILVYGSAEGIDAMVYSEENNEKQNILKYGHWRIHIIITQITYSLS